METPTHASGRGKHSYQKKIHRTTPTQKRTVVVGVVVVGGEDKQIQKTQTISPEANTCISLDTISFKHT
jgi:hypothetical protein